MAGFLIAARAVHYAATMLLVGIFAFLCLVMAPSPRLQRQLSRLAAASLALALVTGASWLVLLSARIIGQPVVTALTEGAAATVLSRTRFGQVWSGRFVLMLALAVLLALPQQWRGRCWRWGGLGLAAGALSALAWAGHGGATPGWPGVVHLLADMLHLLAAGAWIGALLPLALWLGEARRSSPEPAAAIRAVVACFSRLAGICAGLVFAAGLVNTWFLAGTVPALIGTLYGRLLLAKIAIFLIIIAIASVNLLRFAGRLSAVGPAAARLVSATIGHLRRNALIEMALGVAILGIVAVLGTLPPGLHSEAGWPLPFRLELAAIGPAAKAALGGAGALAIMFASVGVASAAAGRYRRSLIAAAGVAALAMLSAIVVRPGIEPAYPTSFYAPAEPYAAASVAHGARVYAGNCAICHGAGGKGDGPAAAVLAVRPADLTAPHLFAHTPGDLFWWVSKGKGGGAMPGFAAVLSAADRWDVINFIRARAAGLVARRVGPKIIAAAAPRLPDFAFDENGRQQTLARMLSAGPALIALFAAPPSRERLAWLAAARSKLKPLGLQIVAVDLIPGQAVQLETPAPAPLAAVAADVAGTLALFRSADDGDETDLLLDRAGEVRARWTAAGAGGVADIRALVDQADRIRQFPAAAADHSGHAH